MRVAVDLSDVGRTFSKNFTREDTMKKSACLFIALSFVFVSIAEAKPAKKTSKKEDPTILLRIRVNGKEQKVVNIPMKTKGIKLTINPTDVAKALEKPAAKPETKKVEAPAVPAPSVEEGKAPSVQEGVEPDDDGIAEIPEIPSGKKKETRSDLAPASAAPIQTDDTKKCGTPFYKNGWFWTIVGAAISGTALLIARHNGLFDVPIYDGNRRHR